MKKLLLVGFFAVTFLTAFTVVENPDKPNFDCQYGRCMRIKSDGNQCKNCAQQSSIYCWSHSK
jgi:hypothetical protein